MKINLNTVFKLLATMLVVSLLILFCSCGARQAEKKRTEESSKTELTNFSKIDKSENTESNIKKSESVIINDQDQTTTIEETVEPLDASKSASYTDSTGKKQELNNAKKTIKTTVKNNNTKTESAAKTEASVKIDKKESEAKNSKTKAVAEKKANDLNIKRDAWSLWNLSWLLVPIVVYLGWKRFKV